jgi:type VII secretion protein EccE
MTAGTQARHGDHWTAVIGIDTRLRTLLPTALLVVWLVAVPVHTWWARALLGVAGALVALLGVVSWAGFTIPQWVARRVHIRRGRRRALTEPIEEHPDDSASADPAAPADASAAAGADDAAESGGDERDNQRERIVLPVTAVSSGDEVGVDWRGGQLIAALDLHGHPHVPHELHQRRVTSEAILPIAELEERLAGLTGGEAPDTVDLVFEARRLTPTRYSTVYDTQLSGQPAVGFRRTLLIARFDPAANPAYYAARTSLPDAVAATMARIRRTVAAADCPATALAGPALKALRQSTMPAAPTLRDPHAAAPATASALERWSYVAPDSSAGMFDAVYAIDPAAFTDARLRDLWSIRADSVIVTLRWSVRGWLGFVRVRTASAPTAPPRWRSAALWPMRRPYTPCSIRPRHWRA